MNSMIYILLVSIKNGFLESIKKPAKLVVFLLLLALMGFVVYSALFSKPRIIETIDMVYLKGIFFGFTTFIALTMIGKSMDSGNTFFDMSDVNLLFVAPISPKRILVYGLVRLANTAFMASFFILFQASTFKQNFNIDLMGLLIVLFTYVLCLVLAQILALLIYSKTNGQPKRKRVVKLLGGLVILPATICFVTQYMVTHNFMEAVLAVLKTPYISFIPVVGWGAEGLMMVLTGKMMVGIFYYSLIVLLGVLSIVIIMVSKAEYYEDVLCATETNFEKKRAIAAGDMSAATRTKRSIKVNKTGIFGSGCKAFFGKHMQEASRENTLFIFSPQFFSMALSACIIIFIMKQNASIYVVLGMAMFTQIYAITLSRGVKELYKPYIYLIPASSFGKLFWSNAECLFKFLCDGTMVFGIVGYLLKTNIAVVVLSILTYTLFSMMLIAINFLSLRLAEVNIYSGVMTPLFMLVVFLIMLPGGVLAALAFFAGGDIWGSYFAFMALCMWELFVSVLFFWLSKGALNNCDMPVMPQRK